jgi:hypothetical protein
MEESVSLFLNPGFVVLSAVTTNITVFWYLLPCNLVEVYQRFVGTYCFNFQGRIVSRAGIRRFFCLMLVFLRDLLFHLEEGGCTFFWNVGKLQPVQKKSPFLWPLCWSLNVSKYNPLICFMIFLKLFCNVGYNLLYYTTSLSRKQ